MSHAPPPRRNLIFQLIFGLPALVVIARVLWPLSLPWAVFIPVSALFLAASQFHRLSRWSSGSVFAPEFPRPLIMLLTWALAASFALAPLQILFDIARLASLAIVHDIGEPARARYAMLAFAGVLAAYGVQQATRVPPLKDIEVGIPGLPASFDGYRLVQLTDMHLSRLFPASWARKLTARVNALGADLIVISGDLIDGSVEHRRADVEPLRDLRARDGVYAIPGNHEYFFDHLAWMTHFTGLGITMLENAHVLLNRDGQKIALAGVNDLSAERFGAPASDLAAALDGIPAGTPIILLNHQPKTARDAAARGVALQLSGHTHGGMIVGLNGPVAKANGGFASGRYDVDGMMLYVNNGTALWPGFAVRLGRFSELTRITLCTL